MKTIHFKSLRRAALTTGAVLAATLCMAHAAHADGKRFGPYPDVYTQECASCHVAYPPELMTKSGWATITSTLDKHFGTDASVDEKTRAELDSFLAGGASTRERKAPSEPTARLTRTSWFVREHGTTPPANTSFANCAACHTQAEKIDYRERGIKLPAGYLRKGD